jgi:hypothetical protein
LAALGEQLAVTAPGMDVERLVRRRVAVAGRAIDAACVGAIGADWVAAEAAPCVPGVVLAPGNRVARRGIEGRAAGDRRAPVTIRHMIAFVIA